MKTYVEDESREVVGERLVASAVEQRGGNVEHRVHEGLGGLGGDRVVEIEEQLLEELEHLLTQRNVLLLGAGGRRGREDGLELLQEELAVLDDARRNVGVRRRRLYTRERERETRCAV